MKDKWGFKFHFKTWMVYRIHKPQVPTWNQNHNIISESEKEWKRFQTRTKTHTHNLWHLPMVLTHRAKFKWWPYLNHLWTKLDLHCFWGCKTVSWKIGSMCNFSTLEQMTKPWTFWEAEENPFQAYIWVTRNFRIKMFQLFSYRKRCVCASTSMKCFHSAFQRDILFILILPS